MANLPPPRMQTLRSASVIQNELRKRPTSVAVADDRDPIEHADCQDRTEPDGDCDPLEIGHACESPTTPVQAKPDVRNGPRHQQQGDCSGRRVDMHRSRQPIEAQRERQIRRDRDAQEVEGKQESSARDPAGQPARLGGCQRARSHGGYVAGSGALQ